MPSAAPILVLHDRPDELRARLVAAAPAERFAFAATPTEVVPALEATHPEVVLSIKHAGFPGAAHRPAVTFPSVRWLQVGGSGYEHLAPWDPARVTVTNAHGALAPYLAETVLGAVLALNHGLLRYRDDQRAGRWSPRRFRPLAGQTLLVVGVGAIGGALAARARALGMRVLGLRAHPAAHPHCDAVHGPEALHALLAVADVVSVHVRATERTAGMFDARAFASMKPTALFVNTARGAVVDEDALRAALDAGALRGAYLDVFAREPLPAESPWWRRDDVLVTPHASDNVEDWPARLAEVFLENLARWRRGDALAHVVTP